MSGTAEAAAPTSEGGGTFVQSQLAALVPSFDPAKDDLTVYTQKVSLLLSAWPEGKYNELATRLILGCSGSAFNKLQIHASEITQNDRKSIQRIVELLGGHWGQINLERQYEYVERALYRCAQKSDESADSYLARADNMWTELLSKSIDLKAIQAYVTLRGSLLSSDDKKRVILDSDGAGSGTLSTTKVQAAIRMLGANFFQDMTGARRGRGKTYDQATLIADNQDMDENSTALNVNTEEYIVDEDHLEVLFQDSLHEGDEDAALIQDFEAAATDLVQSDEDLAMAFNAYSEARRRLTEKFRSRGFWPVSSGKGKGRSSFKGVSKGKFGKGHHSSRKSLQQRIMESKCRICGKVGHWKAECPSRNDATSSTSARSSQAPTSFVQPTTNESSNEHPDALPLEFLSLPEVAQPIDEAHPNLSLASVFVGVDQKGYNDKSKLRETLQKWEDCRNARLSSPRNEVRENSPKSRLMQRLMKSKSDVPVVPKPVEFPEVALFASHSSFGVVDLGATKTAIGSDNVVELLNNLHPKVRDVIERCPCHITFRFGNHGTLQSQQALVIPFAGFRLKVAVVPGATPFLLSNTLLRAIGAVIDTDQNRLWSSKLQRDIPLHLTSKGLFLMDLNDLVMPVIVSSTKSISEPTETHMTIEEKINKPERDGFSRLCDIPKENPMLTKGSLQMNEKCENERTDKKPCRISTSYQDEHQPVIKESNATSSGSRSFASSFRYPSKSQHGVGTEIEEFAGHQQRGSSRSFSPTTGGSSPREDRIRSEALWKELPDCVEPRSVVDHLGGPALRLIDKRSSSQIHPICGTASRKDRTSRRAHRGEGSPTRSEHQGCWEELPAEAQITGDETSRSKSPSGGTLGRRGGLIRDGDQPIGTSTTQCPAPRDSHAQSGECTATCDRPLGGPSHEASGKTCCPIDAVFQMLHVAGDISGDCESSLAPETCKERVRFHQLVSQYQSELKRVQNHHTKTRRPKTVEMLEVFCSPQSSLTHQCQQLGYRAVRFSQEQGDLQSSEGRRLLFELMLEVEPRNIWFSPTCGPWSGWSNLNGSKSIEAWDNLHNLRMKHLEQIALGIVLLRFQREHSGHLHWEQPATSMMFRLPYLNEPFHYTRMIDLDMCVAGDLKDPESGKPIKKGLHILTTSSSFHESMQGLRCGGNHHDHQIIEGSVKYQGQLMNRSKYTELYPRKFARKVARILCSLKVIKETPLGSSENSSLTLAAADSSMPEPKRRRFAAKPKPVRTHPIADDQPNQKRFRLGSKQAVPKSSEVWSQVFDKINSLLPRVGRRSITNTEIVTQIQNLLPEKVVKHVVACKGTNRTIAPPKDVAVGEAPYRLGVYLERTSGTILIDDEWEHWEVLAHRQLIRPSPACRINITVLAANPPMDSGVPPDNRSQSEMTMPQNSPETIPQAPEVPHSSLSDSQHADLKNEDQPWSFKILSKEEQSTLLRAHKNLGHPSPDRFSTVLRQQGFRPEIVRAALELKCSICQAKTEPKHARPSTLKDDLDFNDRISIDGLKWTNKSGQTFHIYHVIDWATSFHTACIAPSRNSEDMIQAMIQLWFQWAGAPGELLIDAATEFTSDAFAQFAQMHDIKVTTISAEAHFQNGKAERHGAVLQHMLSKFELEHELNSYRDLQQALWFCTQAKNACGLRKGYAPEVLVLGKQTRLPGAVVDGINLPAHLLADSESALGIKFKQQLAYRETARRAYHSADNDAALRRSVLRRANPHRGSYSPGEWVMVWKQGQGALPGNWLGPMKVIVQENHRTVWVTMLSKLYRCAPEHIRPVTAAEAQSIVLRPDDNSSSEIARHLGNIRGQGTVQAIDLHPSNETVAHPENTSNMANGPEVEDIVPPGSNPEGNPPTNSSDNEIQPDQEPGIEGGSTVNSQEGSNQGEPPDSVPQPAEIPVPSDDDDELVEIGLWCQDTGHSLYHGDDPTTQEVWRFELTVDECDIRGWQESEEPEAMSFLVSAARRQRAEVKLTQLGPAEQEEFRKAKEKEVNNWLKTNTVEKILRNKLSPEQILRCRWILTWKPIEAEDRDSNSNKSHKAKARLVVLGYLDPQITELPRDAPTLGRHTRMLVLQLIASMSWSLQSFDISAAFLQGKPQEGRIIGLEPVPELEKALGMTKAEVCKLTKGAYGLIDAPYLWYTALRDELVTLGFSVCPMDPCVFVLRHPQTMALEGVLGIHVDDGICGGSSYFQQKISLLEKKYPFGSKKIKQFVFTGIEMSQLPNGNIQMSQGNYVKKIEPIKISLERKNQLESPVTEQERQQLRAVFGSLQYASVHTRPDLSSRLSFLQSAINSATVSTLIEANQAVHEGKKHSDVQIEIQSIHPNDLRFLAFSDASFASKKNPESHTGSIIMSTHRDISKNVSCPVSPISWGCKKIQRVVTSTLAAETTSLSSVLDHLSWIKLCWAWLLDSTTDWKNAPKTLRSLPESFSTATVKANTLPESVAATDCKSLYDLVTRTAPPQCAEFRTQLNARQIKDLLNEGISLRWVHSGAQLADCLTKIMETSFLRETLKLGRYRLNDELQVLKERSNARNRLKWLKNSCSEPSCLCNDECFLGYQN